MNQLKYLICESEHNNEIDLETRNKLISIIENSQYIAFQEAYVEFIDIMEAEEDHHLHNAKKDVIASEKGVPSSELKNKKYKNEESSKRADLQYSYKEKNLTGTGIRGQKFHDITIPDNQKSALKMLEIMHKNVNDKASEEKYKAALKLFCNKYGFDQNASLFITHIKGSDGKEEKHDLFSMISSGKLPSVNGKDIKTPSKLRVSEFPENKKTIVDKLPTGVMFIHQSPKSGLTELRPRNYSNRFNNEKGSELSGQYHPTGRIYLTLVSNDPSEWGTSMDDDHIYKVSGVTEFYVDGEDDKHASHKLSNMKDIKSLLNTPVYIKRNEPIPCKEITDWAMGKLLKAKKNRE